MHTKISGLNKSVSRVLFGTAMGVMSSGEDASEILDVAMSLGINTFDTARGYGLAEESLGRWVSARGNRENVVILSKCGNIKDGVVCVDSNVIKKELEESLIALQTEYIDIYLLHRDDRNVPVSEVIETLNEVKSAGKIKIFGVSNWTHERIEAANEYAYSKGLSGFSVSSPHYGLAVQVEDLWGGGCVTLTGDTNKIARKWYEDNQMPVIAYSALARGFFSGAFRSNDLERAKKVLDEYARKGYLYEINLERLRRAEILAEKYNTTVSMIAMRYMFSSKMNMYSVVSSSKPENIRMNVEATKNRLSDKDISFLEGSIRLKIE